MTRIYLARDSVAAELVRCVLEDAGIAAAVEGAALSTVVGEVPFTAAYPRVIVNDEDAARAAQLIRESGIDHVTRPKTARCANCGYNLTGLTEPRCPECGQAFDMARPRESWKCSACGETSEVQFSACWKCGAERRPAPDV